MGDGGYRDACEQLKQQLQEERKLRSREVNALINRLSDARRLICEAQPAPASGDLEKRLEMIVDIAHGKASLIDLREAFASKQCALYQDVNCVECGEKYAVDINVHTPPTVCPTCRENEQ